MELKADTAIFVSIFLLASCIWLLFSSSSSLSFPTRVKAAATTACFIPLICMYHHSCFLFTSFFKSSQQRPYVHSYIDFLYTKFYPAPQMQKNNPHWIPSAQALDLCQSTWYINLNIIIRHSCSYITYHFPLSLFILLSS